MLPQFVNFNRKSSHKIFYSQLFVLILQYQIKTNNMYNSFLHFVEVHQVSQETIDKCFGKDYFGKYVMYDNCKAINKLAKYLNLGITVKTVHPTWNTVAFKIK